MENGASIAANEAKLENIGQGINRMIISGEEKRGNVTMSLVFGLVYAEGDAAPGVIPNRAWTLRRQKTCHGVEILFAEAAGSPAPHRAVAALWAAAEAKNA